MRQKSDTVALFEQFLVDKRVAGNSSAVKGVRSDEGQELKGDFANSIGGTTSARRELPLIV